MVARAQLLADHVRAVLLCRVSGRAAHVSELQPRHRHPQTHMILIAATLLLPPLPTRLPLTSLTRTFPQPQPLLPLLSLSRSLSDSIFSVLCRFLAHSLLCVIVVLTTCTLLFVVYCIS